MFCLSSAGLALVFGVALGNVVRGVPLGPDGYFHLPLFQILNWYGLLIGVFGLVVLVGHGATFLGVRATGALRERARKLATRVSYLDAVLFVALIGPTYSVRNEMLTNLTDHPWRLIFPALAVGALVAMIVYQRADQWLKAFIASALFIVGLLTTMAAGLYPNVLPAHDNKPFGLTVHNAATGHHALVIALVWWPLGMLLAAAYFIFAYRMFFKSPVKPSASPGTS